MWRWAAPGCSQGCSLWCCLARASTDLGCDATVQGSECWRSNAKTQQVQDSSDGAGEQWRVQMRGTERPPSVAGEEQKQQASRVAVPGPLFWQLDLDGILPPIFSWFLAGFWSWCFGLSEADSMSTPTLFHKVFLLLELSRVGFCYLERNLEREVAVGKRTLEKGMREGSWDWLAGYLGQRTVTVLWAYQGNIFMTCNGKKQNVNHYPGSPHIESNNYLLQTHALLLLIPICSHKDKWWIYVFKFSDHNADQHTGSF